METFDKVENVKHLSVRWAWLIVVVIAASISFYWFSMRPEQIRKECYQQSRVSIYYGTGDTYNSCLKQHGLQ